MDMKNELNMAIWELEIAAFLEGRGETHGTAVEDARQKIRDIASLAHSLTPVQSRAC